jgi:hypothetical protein
MSQKWQRWIIGGIMSLNLLVGLTAYFMRDNLFRELIQPLLFVIAGNYDRELRERMRFGGWRGVL